LWVPRSKERAISMRSRISRYINDLTILRAGRAKTRRLRFFCLPARFAVGEGQNGGRLIASGNCGLY
jgi:hypothetical protein